MEKVWHSTPLEFSFSPEEACWHRLASNISSLDSVRAALPPQTLPDTQSKEINRLMAVPLLTALDSAGHVHLIVGSNPLASARCSKSIEVGAKPKIIAPADSDVHYVLAKRIEDGEVEWIKKNFEDADLSALGRAEVDNVVDAVFVTTNGKNVLSMRDLACGETCSLPVIYRHTYFQLVPAPACTHQCC